MKPKEVLRKGYLAGNPDKTVKIIAFSNKSNINHTIGRLINALCKYFDTTIHSITGQWLLAK